MDEARHATFPPPPAPEGGRPRRSLGRRVGVVAAATGVAAGVAVGAAALAGGGHRREHPGGVDHRQLHAGQRAERAPTPAFGPRGLGRPSFGGGPGAFGSGPVVHGQYTIDGPSGYETIAERTGTVSAVTDTSGSTWSLTVKSADGTSGTFTVGSGTSVDGGETGIASVKVNDSVRVLAVVSGSTATATQVTDDTVSGANAKSWMPPHLPGPGAGAPAPSGDQTRKTYLLKASNQKGASSGSLATIKNFRIPRDLIIH